MIEPEAMRYDFDGYGWMYIDDGAGSSWQTRHPDAEPLYTAEALEQARAEERERIVTWLRKKEDSHNELAGKFDSEVHRAYGWAFAEAADELETQGAAKAGDGA